MRQAWDALRREGLAFWAVNFYVFIEYVRPQNVWPVIDVLPWGQLALGLAIATVVLEPPVARRLHLLDGLLAVFSLVLVASILTAYDPSYAVDRLSFIVNWLVLYYLIARAITNEARLFLLLGAFFLWSLKMSQFGARVFVLSGFRFSDWGIGGGPGWFENSGEFAIQMCVFLALSVHVILALRARWPKRKTYLLLGLLPGTALLSVVMSSSRGGQLAAAGVLVMIIAQSRHRVRGLAWAAVLVSALWGLVPVEQKARFSAMGDDTTSQTRLTYWRHGMEIIQDHPVLGIGYSNWLPYYTRYYNPTGQVPHNIFIQAGAEMGYAGLLAFVLLIVGTLVANARTRRMADALPEWGRFYRGLAFGLDAALVGYLIAGFFVTVLYYPFFWMNLSLTSATLALVSRRYAALVHRSAPLVNRVAMRSDLRAEQHSTP